MEIVEIQKMIANLTKYYLGILAFLCLQGFIDYFNEGVPFGIFMPIVILFVIVLEILALRFELWTRKKVFIALSMAEYLILSILLMQIDSIFLCVTILVSLLICTGRMIFMFEYTEGYTRRILLIALALILIVNALVEMLPIITVDFMKVFGILCIVIVIILMLISFFENLAKMSITNEEKIFQHRRLVDSTREANEELRIHQEKLNKANELLGVQKLKLESAYKTMHEMAIRDPLTGIYNRGHLNQLVDDLCIKALTEDKVLSVVLLDIDHFKLVNDTYGHLFGDSVIITIARFAQEAAERYDGIAARYGGEEFVIVFWQKDIMTAYGIVKEMKEKVSSHEMDYNGMMVNVNVSIGISSYPETCNDPIQLLNNADLAMYYSKQNGRNRITLDSNETRESVRMKK